MSVRSDRNMMPPTQQENPSPAATSNLAGASLRADHSRYRAFGRSLGAISVLALVYFATAKLGMLLPSVHPYATVVWPPSGIAIASLLLMGYRVWPGAFLGAFLANVTVGGSVMASLSIAAGNTLEGLVGALLVNRFANGKDCFHHPQDTFRYVIFAGVLATSIGATVGVGSLWMGGLSHDARFAAVWLTWWLGDGTSVLVIAPVILLWRSGFRFPSKSFRMTEFLALTASILGVGLIVFKDGFLLADKTYPLSYLCVFPLLWAALRFGPLETATSVLVLSGMAIWGRMAGPHVATLPESLLSMQVFVGTISIMVLPLAASVHERRITYEALRQHERELADFLEKAVLGIQWVDPGGTIVWANEALLSLLGYPRDQYIGHRLSAFLADQDMSDDLLRQLAGPREVHDYEVRMRRRNGSAVHVLIDSDVRWEAGKIVRTRCFIRDITRRKCVEDELRDINASLESLVKARTFAWARTNRTLAEEIEQRKHAEALARGQNEILLRVASGTPISSIMESIALFVESRRETGHCAILLFNKEENLLRIGAAPNLPATYKKAVEGVPIPPATGSQEPAAGHKAQADVTDILTDPHWAAHRPLAALHGFQSCWSTPIISSKGDVLGSLVTYDTTPRQLLEKDRSLMRSASHIAAIAIEHQMAIDTALRAEERFRLLVEGVEDYAIYLLDPHGHVITWNDGATRIKGYRTEEVIGKHFSCFYSKEDIQERKPEAALRFAAETGRYDGEGWYVRKDGSKFFASVLITALKDENGTLRGFAKVTQDITSRKNEQRKIEDYTRRLHFLSHRLLELQEVERRDIARELHDETGQALTALKINLQRALRLSGPSADVGLLEDSVNIVEGLLKNVRDLSLDLHPPMLDDLGLVAALRWSGTRQAERGGFNIQFQIDEMAARLPGEVEAAFFRIAQEALTNISRHAEANDVTLSFRRVHGGIELLIRDDGKGFDTDSTLNRAVAGESMGLLGMQERAHLIGAGVSIESSPGRGTCIHLKLPLPFADMGAGGGEKGVAG